MSLSTRKKFVFAAVLSVFAAMLVAGPAFSESMKSSNLGLQLETPAGWTTSESGDQGTGFNFYVTPSSAEAKQAAVSVWIYTDSGMYGALPAGQSDISRWCRANFASGNNPNYEFVSEQDLTFAGVQAHEFIFKNVYEGETRKVLHKYVYIMKDGVLYTFGFSVYEDAFNRYWPELKVVFDSVRFSS